MKIRLIFIALISLLMAHANLKAFVTSQSSLTQLPTGPTIKIIQDIWTAQKSKKVFLQDGQQIKKFQKVDKNKAYCEIEYKKSSFLGHLLAKERQLKIVSISKFSLDEFDQKIIVNKSSIKFIRCVSSSKNELTIESFKKITRNFLEIKIPRQETMNLQPQRLNTQSPWYHINEGDIDLHESYSAYDEVTSKRIEHLTIWKKAISMIQNSKKLIVGNAFLFDIVKADNSINLDVVKKLTAALIQKKKQDKDIKIIIIFDQINRAYEKRISDAVKELNNAGIDVFYSDLLETKGGNFPKIDEFIRESWRGINSMTYNIPSKIVSLFATKHISIDTPLGEGVSLEMLWKMIALKANHRKLLVTDSNDKLEALISSANPHNASIPNTNFAVSVKGKVANYIYETLREDVITSIKYNYVDWSNTDRKYQQSFLKGVMPSLELTNLIPKKKEHNTPVAVSFMTEIRIKDQILKILKNVRPGDQVRLQMFYLSEMDVINAIINASLITKEPVRIILDPNKGAFNIEKDGTPNRQVADFLLEKKKELNLNLDIRWYATHGEQNHAKIMSVTNPHTSKYILINGSANWTSKNLENINMEANIVVKNSKKITGQFNEFFDTFWTNRDGLLYSLDYEAYKKHASYSKWRNGEKFGFVSW